MKRSLLLVGLVALLLSLAALDATRAPDHQFTGRLYIAAVHFYQQDIHPHTSHYVRCRYNPTCSHYSAEAVQRYGIAKGLRLTVQRVVSCRGSVPMGTYDPVPN